MTKPAREFIGRSALFLLGAMFLFGGYKCIVTGMRINEEARKQRLLYRASTRNRDAGGGLPIGIGCILLLIGAPLAFAALVPVDVFARFFGPPQLRTGDNDLGLEEEPSRVWWRFWRDL